MAYLYKASQVALYMTTPTYLASAPNVFLVLAARFIPHSGNVKTERSQRFCTAQLA